MNYYNRYPSHYLAATVHLSMEQDGAYGRLMDWYYSNERAIPHDKRYVIARAQSSSNRKAVDEVLVEFFDQTEEGWTQRRIEKELELASPRIDAARVNGKKGGRPRKEKPSGFKEQNPVGFHNKTQKEPSAKAPQPPYPIQEQKASPHAPSSQDPPAQPVQPTEAGRACLLLRQSGCARVNPSHPDLLAALAEGVAPEAIRDTYLEAPDKTNPFAWAISTARGRHAEGAKQIATTTRTGPAPQKLGKTAQAIQALEDMKHGNRLDLGRDFDGNAEASTALAGIHASS